MCCKARLCHPARKGREVSTRSYSTLPAPQAPALMLDQRHMPGTSGRPSMGQTEHMPWALNLCNCRTMGKPYWDYQCNQNSTSDFSEVLFKTTGKPQNVSSDGPGVVWVSITLINNGGGGQYHGRVALEISILQIKRVLESIIFRTALKVVSLREDKVIQWISTRNRNLNLGFSLCHCGSPFSFYRSNCIVFSRVIHFNYILHSSLPFWCRKRLFCLWYYTLLQVHLGRITSLEWIFAVSDQQQLGKLLPLDFEPHE